METLVYYKQLLVQKHSASLPQTEADRLVGQCLDLLRQLEDIDPQRRQRYQDLGEFSFAAQRYNESYRTPAADVKY